MENVGIRMSGIIIPGSGCRFRASRVKNLGFRRVSHAKELDMETGFLHGIIRLNAMQTRTS